MLELFYIINQQTMKRRKIYTGLLTLVLILVFTGCGGGVKNVAKSDIDMAADAIVRSLDDYIRRLALELYRTNPKELSKNTGINLEQRLNQIVEYPIEVAYHEINHKQQIQAMELALDDAYHGDRVFALMIGISSMIRLSYDNQREFFIFDTIDPQKVYHSSYNLQLLKLRLLNMAPNLLHIDTNYGDANNAYIIIEKISTTQDIMSRIISDKSSRIINKTLMGTATTFIPIM